ncbi:MAG TPA: TonB-dependent receptor [Vicinamibacterales bacterium]|nr:TonB-dependent receptor [Vicinamibacterales bacterium]
MKPFLFFTALLYMVSVPSLTFAQVDRATLSGVVTDAVGAVVPGAQVTLTNTATSVSARQESTDRGTYLFVNLIPGPYRLDVERPGFQKSSQRVELEVGQRALVDITLNVGITETVTVTERTPVLNTSNALLGRVVPQTAVANLPLAIRNWDDLLAMVPGVQGNRFTEEGGGTSFGRTGGVNVHGQRSLQNNFLLDGVDNNSISTNVQELTTQVSRPSVDAIQEFKVVTSAYSAEYGRVPGAAISVSTKSGTNNFHGTAYDYFRNEKFDANNFFSIRAGAEKPANDQNQTGANLGGRLVANRAFFFADYERTRITRGVTRLTRVPTDAERNGRFSTTILDPVTRLPFENNTIPPDRIDPTAAAILALVPPPNQSGANNYFRQPEVKDDSDRILTRIDLTLSPNNRVFGRHIYSDRFRFIPGAFGGIIDGTGTSAFGRQDMNSHGLVAGWTRIVSSRVVNEFRVSWTTANSDAVQDPFGQAPPAAATVRGVPEDATVLGGLAGIQIDDYFGGSGLGRIGSPDFLPKFQRTKQLEFVNTLSWSRDAHEFKIGANTIVPMSNEYLDVPATRGQLRFRNRFSGNPMADFLLGYVSDAQLSNVHVVEQRHWTMSYFIQDDWRVTGKLSLTLGLRYDFITPALEGQNRQTNFVPEDGGRLVFATDGSLESRGLVKPDWNNLAPRLGAAYSLNERTVIRGGFGVFYNLFDRVGSEDQLSLNLPGLVNNSVASSLSAGPVFLLRNGFPAGFLNVPNLDPAAGQLARLRIRAVDENAPKSTVYQFSVGMQRELARMLVVTVDFVANEGRNLATLVNLNQPLNGNGPRPFPQFGFIEWRAQNGRSSYKGVEMGLEKRYAQGFSFGVGYTLSESRDWGAEHLGAQGSPSFPQDARNLEAWEGPSDFDTRHRFGANFVVELPFGAGKRWATDGVSSALLGGWTIAGIYAASSGRPFTVRQGNNDVGQNMTGMPNLVGDPEGPKTVDQWFNVSAFQTVPTGTFGDAGRNILRAANWQSFDLTISRRLGQPSGIAATLRVDIFNVFNRTNLGPPERDLGSPSTVGRITSLAGDPRVMQFSVRLTF